MFQFSQRDVKESDFLGLQYLYKTGYDPRAAVEFLKKVQATGGDRSKQQSTSSNTHPPAEERVQLMQNNIELALPARANNILNTPEFDAIKMRLAQ